MKGIDLKGLKLWQMDAAGVALCVALTLVLYLSGLGPLFQRCAERGAREAELQAQCRKASQRVKTHMAMRVRVAEVKKSLAQCKLELQPASHVNRRIAQISSLAAQAGLKIDEISPGAAASGSRYEMVPISLSGKGTYVTCVGFLHRLHKVFPDTGVSSLALQGNPAESAGAAQFRFDLLWYAAPRSAP